MDTPTLLTTPRAFDAPRAYGLALDWSPRLAEIGGVVEGVSDIDQAILIILSTPLRSDPLRPTFGWGGYDYLDLPPARAVPHLVRETWEAIRLWEPRVTLIGVAPQALEGHHWQITVSWELVVNGQVGATQVAL